MAAEEFCSIKCVLERFHIEKFRETQQKVIVSLLEEKDVLVSQPTAFLPDHMHLRCCVDESDLLVVL